MNKIKFFFITILIILFATSCSYQKMNSVNQKKFHIQEFEISGDARDSFLIQKKIKRFSKKNSENKIKIFVELKKSKTIKEKNIQNKVTKYNLSLTANVKIVELNSTKVIERTFRNNQSYSVDDSYSSTVNNSKDAYNLLIDTIVNEILDQLRIYYN